MDTTFEKDYEVLTETTLNRVVNGHNTDGYVMISASRGDCMKNFLENPSAQQITDENNRRTKELREALRNLHYSYVPVYGGYKEAGSDKAVIEKSFIVFPYDNKGNARVDFDTFEQDMIALGKKYNQDAILIKEPSKNARYSFPHEDEWDLYEFKNASLNDVQKEYFTALKSWADISLNRKGHTWDSGSKPQRFTYEESYLDYAPQTLMGANARYNSGEIFSMAHYKK